MKELRDEVFTVEKKEEENKEERRMPTHVTVFDPEKPLFETQHLCIYLSELEEEKEHK